MKPFKPKPYETRACCGFVAVRSTLLSPAATVVLHCPCSPWSLHPFLVWVENHEEHVVSSMHIYPKRACLEGLEVEIFKLVSYSATPEQWKEWLRVPLEHAAARGNLDLFNKLLGAGADGGAGWRGCRGRTLLDAAAVGGNEEIVSGLLRVEAQPDVKVVSCASKRSALYTATMLGHEDAATKLVFAGADVDFQDPITQLSILHEATRGGHGQLVKDLLLARASVDVRDEHGATPLHIAASDGVDKIVSDLLLKGPNKNARDNRGYSSLMRAAEHGHLSVAQTLLASGAKLNFRRVTYPAHSALDLAAEKGHVRVLQAVLDRGAYVNSPGTYGDTALHVAAESDQAGSVHALIEAGADIGSIARTGWTPFIIAAVFTNPRAMLALLQHGADANARDENGWTPLHFACFETRTGIQAAVDLLLRWGADETAVNLDGETIPDMLQASTWRAASEGEIENVCVLLARAPADRAWRRRGWLVMLRSRVSIASTSGDALSSRSDSNSGGGSKGAGSREGEGREVERRENGQAANHAASKQARRDDGGDGSEAGALKLDGVVGLLLGLETEGIFRSVVAYL